MKARLELDDARQVAPGAALDALRSGAVDARQIALLEVPPPSLAPASEDEVRDVAREANRIAVRTHTTAPGRAIGGPIRWPAMSTSGRPAASSGESPPAARNAPSMSAVTEDRSR